MSMYTLITGASRGIGEAFARELARRGHSLILVARDVPSLKRLQQELTETCGVKVQIIPMDLAEPKAAEKIYRQTREEGWDVCLLINNAGFGRFGEFESHPVEDYEAMVQVNVMAPMSLCHFFVGLMQQRGHGAILQIASMAAFQPTPYLTVYGATKAFLRAFSEGLSGEYLGTGVRILVVCPGLTDSYFFKAAGWGAGKRCMLHRRCLRLKSLLLRALEHWRKGL